MLNKSLENKLLQLVNAFHAAGFNSQRNIYHIYKMVLVADRTSDSLNVRNKINANVLQSSVLKKSTGESNVPICLKSI